MAIQHFTEKELREHLDSHNPEPNRGFLCQCMPCLYRLWYWKMQYKMDYPNKPEWAYKPKDETVSLEIL